MFASSRNKPVVKIPLQIVLIVPFVILVMLVVGLVGYLSFRNGQQAVNDVAHQLRDEINTRIEEHLHTFLDTPHQINQVNTTAIREGWLEVQDSNALERHFWEQIQTFESVTSIYFGNTAGGLVNSGREGAEGSLYVIVTDGFAQGAFRKYATDNQGNRTNLLATVPDFDARVRPWYTNAVEKGGATWSEIYILFTGQDMAIAASRPVYDEQQRLLGVVSVDLFLSQLSDFLKNLDIGETGQSFIIERSGLLIASSTDEKLFTEPNEEVTSRRLYASESATPLIHGAAEALTERFGNYQAITTKQQFEFEIDGQRQFLQVSPVQHKHGLDWLIVTVIPESDFMAQINANNRTTVFLILVALVLAVVLGIVTARWLTRPIMHLNASAHALAQGEWTQTNIDDNWIGEIGELTLSFNQMAGQLQQTLKSLTTEIDEHKRTVESLRESEERLELVLEGAELGMWDWNVQAGDVVFNERWAEMLGYTLDEIEPNVSSWEKLMHPDEIPAVMATLTDHLEGRTPLYQTEHRLRSKSGEWKWVLDTGKVFTRDEQGNPIRAAGTHQDITERKRMEKQLVQQERLAAIGQLAAGVAHDFNNILTSILGFTELLQLSSNTPESMQPNLQKINDASQRAVHLVRQVLDFSRKTIRRPQQIDLAYFIKETIKFLEATIPENIQITLEIAPGDYLIEVDPAQMQQVMTNLTVNARDAMSGGGELRIGLSRVECVDNIHCAVCNQPIAGEWIHLKVKDTGSGVSADVLPHIFEPFFTTREIGDGSGLGLSQVAGIVEQHGGHTRVESQVKQGATFFLYLPPLAVKEKPSEPVPTQISQGQGETILLVEDEPTVLEAITEMLEYLGYRILTTSNGEQAIAIFEVHKAEIALVLSDVVMPDMDGETLFHRLKAKSPHLKMILMSGYPLGERGAKLLSLGIVDWFQKPISFGQLSQVVGKVSSNKKGRWG